MRFIVILLVLFTIGFASQTDATISPPRACTGHIITAAENAIVPGVPVGACLSDQELKDVGLDSETQAAREYFLRQENICAGFKAGFPSNFDTKNTNPDHWVQIREGYVYTYVGTESMNPGALKCFHKFFEQAKAQGFKPCSRAAYRSTAHQRSSCLNPSNTVVCGRSDRGTGPLSSCSKDLSAYKGCAHTKGTAMDISDHNPAKQDALLQLAEKFGFSKVGASSDDPWHVEAAQCANGNYKLGGVNTTDTWTGASGGSPYSSSLYGQTGQSSGLNSTLNTGLKAAQLGVTGLQLANLLNQPSQQSPSYGSPGTTVGSAQPQPVSTLIQKNCLNPNQTTSGNTAGTGAQTTLQSASNNTSLTCLTYDESATNKSTSELLTAISPENEPKIVPIALNTNTLSEVNEQGSNNNPNTNNTTGVQMGTPQSGTVAYEHPQGGAGTFSSFTSTDLKDSGSTVKASTTLQKLKNIPQATYQAILNTLKSILLKINEYISYLIQKRQATVTK